MKLDPYKFVGKDKLRPWMHGVYYSNGYVTATDAHALMQLKDSYPKTYEKKILKKDGSAIAAKYPRVSGVIPDKSTLEPYQVDVKELTKVYSDALKKNKEVTKDEKKRYWKKSTLLEEGRNGIMLIDPFDSNGRVKHVLSMDMIAKLLYYLKTTGTDTIWINKKSNTSQAVMAYTPDSLALFMPLRMDGQEAAKAHFKYSIRIRPEAWARRTETPKKKATKTTNNMKKTTSKRTATKKSTVSTMKKASTILGQQKKDWQRIFKAEVKKSTNSQAAAKKAGSLYRSKYGSTPKARWKNAIKEAKRK